MGTQSASGDLQPLSEQDFEKVRELLHRTCGISIQAAKRPLVSSRLEKLVRSSGLSSFRDYLAFLNVRKNGTEFGDFIDILTTNHSGFWREPEHFHFLRSVVLAQKKSTLRIWSAACATGQEPYTISMCAAESGVVCEIVASDISRTALAGASRGEYELAKLAALPPGWESRYFESAGGATVASRRVKRSVRTAIRFCQMNLLQPFEHLGLFDVIFCRNVMIYFDQSTRDQLVDRLVSQLIPGGYLFTGHSETLLRFPSALRYVQPATYCKT